MNTNLKRVVSGLAALGIALSGMALGAGSAWAGGDYGGGDDGDTTVASAALKQTDTGTITISGGAIAHTFKGYRLGWLDSISYDEESTTEDTENAVMAGYTLETNPKYKEVIETALKAIKNDGNNTLLSVYKEDKNYCANECTEGVGAGDPNPLGWLVSNYITDDPEEAYTNTNEGDPNWGGDAKDGSEASVLRQFATEVSKAIKGMTSASTDSSDIASLESATGEAGHSNPVKQGFYLLRDTTNIAAGSTAKDDPNKETQSAPILVSTTYTVSIPSVDENADENTESQPVPVTFTFDAGGNTLGQVSLKNSTPTITKKVVKPAEDSTLTAPKYEVQNQPDYAVGDTVYYELTAKLPYYTGYANGNRVYKITDTESAGLTVDLGDTGRSAGTTPAIVSVKITPDNGSVVTLSEGKDYVVSKGEAPTEEAYKDGTTTIIDFAKYVNLVQGSESATRGSVFENDTVTVIFKATLNNKAAISDANMPQGNPSKDSLTYSNQPEDVTQTHTTPGDDVNVYTYRFRLHKTDKAGKALRGATFHVSAPDDAEKWLAWDGANGKWTYAEDEDEATDFISGEDGNVVGLIDPEGVIEEDNTVNLDRLDSGAYTVKETKAPDDYSQAFLPTFTFTINPTMSGEDGQKTIDSTTFSDKDTVNTKNGGNGFVTSSAAITADVNDKGAWQYTIYNAKNLTQLPMTGGAGLAAVIALGVLLGGAGVAAAVRSRKSNTRAVRV